MAEQSFLKQYRWPFSIALYILLFALFVIPSSQGPDSNVYFELSKAVLDKGIINLLGDDPLQVTKSFHFPVTQVIGGTVFVIPCLVLGRFTCSVSLFLFPKLAPYNDLNFHYDLWIGIVSFHMALLICYFVYKVALTFFSKKASLTAVLLSCLGGPVLLYASQFPLSTNLYAAFIAALLIYVFVFSNKTRIRAWVLLGLICGFGVFVRNEFIIWTLLPLSYLVEAFISEKEKLPLLFPLLAFALSFVIAIIPDILIRVTLFGSLRSSYSAQYDPVLFWELPAMLFGGRNGLFSFWPALLLCFAGYFIAPRKNPPLLHVLMIIVVIDFFIICLKPFWSGEAGPHIGQRNILLVIPCFMLFGACLFDRLKRWHIVLTVTGIVAVCWTMLVTAVYGAATMHHHIEDMAAGMFRSVYLKPALEYLFLPRSEYSGRIALFFAALLFVFLYFKYRVKISYKQVFFKFLIVILVLVNITSIAFLAGAAGRGKMAFQDYIAQNPGTTVIYDAQFDIHSEVIGYALDFVAYFLELDKIKTAAYFENKFTALFMKTGASYVIDFKKMCAAVKYRRKLGWERLVPEQNHWAVRDWWDALNAENGSL